MTPRCDWYQATIRVDGRAVRDALQAEYSGSRLDPIAPRLGYGAGYAVVDGLGRRATVMEGGRNVWPNVTGSGQDGPGVMQLLRSVFPEHEVTRSDACVDFGGAGAWDRTVEALYRVADRHRVKVRMAGDWRPGKGEDGRTLYLGSEKSAVTIRAYEKGKERRIRGDQSVGLDVVRLEVMVRPKDSARLRAAVMEPADLFGFARFARDAFREVVGFDVEEARVRDFRQSDDRRALTHMATQYQPVLDRLADRAGSWEMLMEMLRLEVGAARAERRRQA